MPASPANAREQVIELLREDHKHVKKHFREFEKMDPGSKRSGGSASRATRGR